MKAVHLRVGQGNTGIDFAVFDPALNQGVWSVISFIDPVAGLDPIRCESRSSAVAAVARELCVLRLADRPFEAHGFNEDDGVWALRFSGRSFVAHARLSYVEGERGISVRRWRSHPSARNIVCEECQCADFVFKDVCLGCYRR